jgi:AcrR family transcriptional regulator
MSVVPKSAVGGAREGGNVMEMQRRRLLLAIGEVVVDRGLDGASVGAVCQRAGMSRRTFYELFEDREACFLAAFELAVDRVAHVVVGAYEQDRRGAGVQGWRERVRAALTALLECFDAEPGLARLCVVETLRAGPAVLERRRQILELLAAAVDEGRRESKRGSGPVPLAAEAVVGGALSVIHARLLAHPAPTVGARGSRADARRSLLDTAREDARRPLLDGTREDACQWLLELRNPLMSMIVHPYLGAAAAERELSQPLPQGARESVEWAASNGVRSDPFRDLSIRFTYRTARVLATIASEPGISNREVGDSAGVHDQGQMSKLLHRLQRNGLIDNQRSEHARGEPNAWRLTPRGEAVQTTLGVHATTS